MTQQLAKFALLATYAAALAVLAGWLNLPEASSLPRLALILLGAHVLELPFAYRHLHRYPGSFAVSVLLTLLYGLFHWRPLAQAAAREKKSANSAANSAVNSEAKSSTNSATQVPPQ